MTTPVRKHLQRMLDKCSGGGIICPRVVTSSLVCIRNSNISPAERLREDLNVATESAVTNYGSILLSFRDVTSTFCPRAFCLSGPLSWNALPSQLRDPAVSINIFRQSLKTFLFNNYSDWLCFVLYVHVFCYLSFRHRARFRDSFCLASVFWVFVYLLTYNGQRTTYRRQ